MILCCMKPDSVSCDLDSVFMFHARRNTRHSTQKHVNGGTFFGPDASVTLSNFAENVFVIDTMTTPDELNTQLEAVLNRIKTNQTNLRTLQTTVLGLTISLNDLTVKLTAPGLASSAKAEVQRAVEKDNQKLGETQNEQVECEKQLGLLMAEKAQLMQQLADAQPDGAGKNPIESVGVQGSQINSIPLFDGSAGVDGESWIKMVDRAKGQFNWTSKQTAQTVRNRLVGEARLFVDNQENEGLTGLQDWDEGRQNLRAMLVDKFGYSYSAATAAHALEDLKQNQGETVDQLYERIRFAVTKFLGDSDKSTPALLEAYRNMFQKLVFTHFKGGMFQQYRQAIYSSQADRHPTTARQLLEAARSAELEAGKSKKDVIFRKVAEIRGANAAPQEYEFVSTDEPHSDGAAAAEKDKKETAGGGQEPEKKEPSLADLAKEIEALQKRLPPGKGKGGQWRGRGRGGGRRGRGQGRGRGGRGGCNGCGAMDHWWRQCPQNPNQGGAAPRGALQFQGGAGPAHNPYQQQMQGGQQQWGRQANELTFEEGFYEPLN